MITSKLYPTNQTVAETNIELTKIVSEIDNPLPNIAEPYYMGYVRYENFPKQFNLNTVEIPEDGSSITFTPVEENHSWGYIKQAGAGTDFRGTTQLYAYKSDNSIYEYDTSSNAHCRFINQIKMANVNTLNRFQIDIRGIIIKDTYLEEIQTANGSFAFYHNNNPDAVSFPKTINFSIDDFVEIYNNRRKFSFTITWNSIDYTIEFNKEDYISDTVAKVSLANGLTAYLSIINFSFDGRADYYTSLGVGTTMTITPFFSQTIPEDHEATGIIAQENAVWVPHNIQIGDSRFRYNYYVSTFSNIGAPGAVAGMIPGNFPLGTLTIDEFEAAGFNANYDGMINEIMFLSGTGSVDWGDEHYYGYRYFSQISFEDMLREITIYNKYNRNNVSPIATYTDDFKTSLFSDTDEPENRTRNGNYPQDEEFSNALRPWQIPGQVITVNEYDPADIPPFNPDEDDDGDDPTAPPNGGASGDTMRLTPWNITGLPFINYGAFDINGINKLAQLLWQKPDSFFNALTMGKDINPLDYIVSLTYFPIDLRKLDNLETTIQLGRGGELTDAQLAYTPLDNLVINAKFQPLKIKPYYEDFRDYNPYTKIFINLPFCGLVELNPALVIGKELVLHLTIDLPASAIIWTVSIKDTPNGSDGYILTTVSGTIGSQIPLNGANASQMASNMVNAGLQTGKFIAGTALSIAGGIASGGITSAVAAAGEAALTTAGVDIAKTATNFAFDALKVGYQQAVAGKEIIRKAGNTSGIAASLIANNRDVYLIYQRPISENPKNYGHTVGYLVNKQAKIKEMSGFTVCNNIDISSIGKATAAEKAQIKRILESGFYA